MTTNATPSPDASESEREALLALCDALNEGESEECHIYMSELRQALRVSGLSLTADPAPVFGVTEEQVENEAKKRWPDNTNSMGLNAERAWRQNAFIQGAQFAAGIEVEA